MTRPARLNILPLMIVVLMAVCMNGLSAAALPGGASGRAVRAMPTGAPMDVYRVDRSWYALPRDMSSFERGALEPPDYKPRASMLPSVRQRWMRFFAALRTVSFVYLILYGFLIFPLHRYGAYGLTLYERINRSESIAVGERTAVALWRAQRRYRVIPVEKWHPLSTLPQGAILTFPLPGGGKTEGMIAERREYWEPDNMRQWRLYVLDSEGKPETHCLLIQPRQMGDWRKVIVRAGIAHPPFTTEEATIDWPPQAQITLLGEHGWPAKYDITACNWQRAGINPLPVDLYGVIRRASDPPGRQYQPRLGAFWSYVAARRQNHRPSRRHLDIFMHLSDVVMVETNDIPAREVSYELRVNGSVLPRIREKV